MDFYIDTYPPNYTLKPATPPLEDRRGGVDKEGKLRHPYNTTGEAKSQAGFSNLILRFS